MPLSRKLRRARLVDQIASQRRWIEGHGGSIVGYIARYGRADDPRRTGAGGAAIYAADTQRLADLEDQLAQMDSYSLSSRLDPNR